MKRFVFLAIAIIFINIASYAQKRPQQNVRRVIVTSKYELQDGLRTGVSMAIKQELKDSLYRTHTVLNRDYTTQAVTSHTWFTFNGKQIVREDDFLNQNLRSIKLFTYNADSLIATETVYLVKPGDTTFYLKLNYSYEQHKKPNKIIAENAKGKKTITTKSIYDSRGTEIKRTVNWNKSLPPLDSIIHLTNAPVYDSLDRVISEVITRRYVNGATKTSSLKYSYNEKGLLSSVEVVDVESNLYYKKELEYNEKGMLKFISIYDRNKKLIEYYAKRYELYPSKDRRYQIIEY